MSTLVLVDVQIKPEAVGEFTSYMEEIFPDTRTFKGCRRVELAANQDDPNSFVLVEEWDTREDHQKYYAWRTETGAMARIGSMLAAPPNRRYFDTTNA